MATATKPKSTKVDETEETETQKAVKEAEAQIDEQIEVFEPVPLSVERTLHVGDKERVFVQHEMGFLTKLKFFRLLGGTIRLASEDQETSVLEFLGDILGLQDPNQITEQDALSVNELFGMILRLIELTPEFAEQLYVFALNAKPEEQAWVIESLENLTDDEGFDILEVFVAQNGKALRDFFTKHLRRVAGRFNEVMELNQDTEQE